jgi:cell wall-associated NlpC family hydrolase
MNRLAALLLFLSFGVAAQPAGDATTIVRGSEDQCPDDDFEALREDSVLVSGIIADAMSFLGAPYVYGGTGPSGFDCSGLIYRVFNDNGLSLPRTVSGIEAVGEEVAREDLRPGDLLIFESPTHIGLFIGNGEFIHSSSYQDRGVVVTSLEQANYSRRYSSARRVI